MDSLETLAARVREPEGRVEELEDERAIRELLARYGYNADACRDEAYVELFTDDGVMDLTVMDGSAYAGQVNRWEGKECLREFIADPAAHQRPGFYGRAMHVQGNNVVCHIDGGRATVNSYSLVLRGDGPGPVLVSAGNNQWIMQKVDGRWLIRERRRREVGGEGYVDNLTATPE